MSGKIFLAPRIHPFNPRGAGGDAIAVENGQIVAVSTQAVARELLPRAEIIDLGDVTVTPGLVDAHMHITEWAVARTRIDLSTATSIAAAARAVAGAAPVGGWILGRGWNPHHWGGAYPTCADLDAVAPDVPVALESHDMHAMWLNSAALKAAGVARLPSDPAGGRIVRDENGEPTGVLLENATDIVVAQLPHPDAATLMPLLVAAQQELHRYGITGIHSLPGVHLREPDPLPLLNELLERGELKLRVLQHISLDRLDDAIRLGLRSGFGDEYLRVGGVKLFLDGALGSRTAWMRMPYEHSSDYGVQILSERDFRDIVQRAAAHGIATVVHAIGDAAVSLALDVLSDEAVNVRALAHRIEHVQCLPPDRFDTLAARIVCSVQPSHLMTDWRAADRHWGERAAGAYAFRSMLDNGAKLACGSDAPVESADPRAGIFAAIARTDLAHEPAGGWHPEQKITLHEVLAAYTTGPAYAAGVHATRTGLAPAAVADFVAWRQDPFAIDAEELLTLEAVTTVLGGEIVFGG